MISIKWEERKKQDKYKKATSRGKKKKKSGNNKGLVWKYREKKKNRRKKVTKWRIRSIYNIWMGVTFAITHLGNHRKLQSISGKQVL